MTSGYIRFVKKNDSVFRTYKKIIICIFKMNTFLKTIRKASIKVAYFFAIGLGIIIINSCASIVSKNKYPISFNSNPPGARIIIKDKFGSNVYSGETPTVVRLDAHTGFFSKAEYRILFEKDGYQSQGTILRCNLDGWYVGNIIFGGLIGLLIVDPATGAMWKFKREYVNKNLKELGMGSNEDHQLEIIDINQIPENIKEELVRLK